MTGKVQTILEAMQKCRALLRTLRVREEKHPLTATLPTLNINLLMPDFNVPTLKYFIKRLNKIK